MNALGRHVLVEFFGCNAEKLNDVLQIEQSMVSAAKEAGSSIINLTFHHFSPFGMSGVVVIQESHLAVHTWPEYKYSAVDLFTCGDTVDPWISYKYLMKAFQAQHGTSMEIKRGQLNLLQKLKPQTIKDKDKIKAPTFSRNVWFTEGDDNIALSFRHKGDPLFRKKSPYQLVEVYDTYEYGKILTCDGNVMCAEKDEHVYHEMIAHVPMFTHPHPQDILVIGGGDGGAVREILKHEGLKKVTLVEIDKVVIKASKKYLPTISSALNHPKLNLIIEDGIKFIESTPDSKYDMVIIDSTDPVGPAAGLFKEDFYLQVYRILKPTGIMVSQSESPRYNIEIFKKIFHYYRKIFGQAQVFCYLAYIPTYLSGMWSFSFCVKGLLHPLDDIDSEKAQIFTEKQSLNYYSYEIHQAAFILPKFVQEMLNISN
jgi:spermidine synthase